MRWTRTLGFGLLGLAVGALAVAYGPPPVGWTAAPPAGPKASSGDDAFALTVRPLLARRGQPCHVPGGVMYARLPFDDPKVVRDHRPGILRRLKEPDEREVLLAWLGPEG